MVDDTKSSEKALVPVSVRTFTVQQVGDLVARAASLQAYESRHGTLSHGKLEQSLGKSVDLNRVPYNALVRVAADNGVDVAMLERAVAIYSPNPEQVEAAERDLGVVHDPLHVVRMFMSTFRDMLVRYYPEQEFLCEGFTDRDFDSKTGYGIFKTAMDTHYYVYYSGSVSCVVPRRLWFDGSRELISLVTRDPGVFTLRFSCSPAEFFVLSPQVPELQRRFDSTVKTLHVISDYSDA